MKEKVEDIVKAASDEAAFLSVNPFYPKVSVMVSIPNFTPEDKKKEDDLSIVLFVLALPIFPGRLQPSIMSSCALN